MPTDRDGGGAERMSRRDVARWWALDYVYAAGRQIAALGQITRPKPPDAWSRGDPGRPSVLLLAGVYEHWSFLRPIGDALCARGHRVRVVHGLGANLLGIGDTADRALRALERVPVPTAGWVIVAHSKGGLVGKRMLLSETAPKIGLRGVVAVATPFGGSRLARYVLDPVLREFHPGSPTIVELADGASVNAHIVSVFGTFDPHVPEGSALDGAMNVQVPVAGHFRILAAPETLDAVVDGVARLAAIAPIE